VNGTPKHTGIFWLVQTSNGEARLLAAGCPLDQAEPYGDCLTYCPGHYETWAQWRRDRTVDPALRALYGSTNTKTGRADASSFDQSRDLFVLYADRKLLTPATIARIETQFHLPLVTSVRSAGAGFTGSLKKPTPIPNPSSGPLTPNASSLLSNEGKKS
jgi:hypothetical protein